MNLLSSAPHNPDYEAFSMEAGLEARFAFTAQFWGNGAVVCRAVENRPEPVIEQQFGQFPTWTQANTCASKLNEGLGLDPLDVRQIVTSSFLATACIIQGAVASFGPVLQSKLPLGQLNSDFWPENCLLRSHSAVPRPS